MKKLFTFLLGAAISVTASAQTILEEDFETGNTGSKLTPVAKGAGWTTVNGYTGKEATYNWHNYYSAISETNPNPTISGQCCAAVQAPMSTSAEGGFGPREEILLTPELTLDDTYQLQFTFRVSPVNATDASRYDLQVRVVEDGNLTGAETVFSIQNEKMMRDAGITTFPISNWNPYTAKIDLSDFKGANVKLAFVYKMLHETANVLWLDDVIVKKFTPATGPVPSVNVDSYTFGSLYIGERIYSDVLTLTNVGKDGLKITGLDLPQGVSVTFDPSSVDLQSYQQLNFRMCYEAAMSTPASGNVVIHTNGGDATIAFTANKQFVPEGSVLETFNDYFPPAGWTNSGWTWTPSAIEGEHSALGSGDHSASYLRSPRLDLTEGGKVIFTYYNNYDGETAPEYDITLDVSYDGGSTWTTKWTSDYQSGLNKLLTASVDLGYGDDQCYVRWFYPAVESDDEGAYEHSAFTLDRVLLPNVVGADGVPTRATIISPANGATEVLPRDVVLKWGPAQFAKGYKVYVGTNTEVNDLVNGVDVGTAMTYTIPECACSTKYYWKVVGYNDKGDATSAPRWNFTTQADATVTEYPYVENFMSEEIPTGWSQTPSVEYNREWYINSIYKYTLDSNTYGALTSGWLYTNNFNAITTQEFQLPADKDMNISFIWGDEHPSSLKVDPTGMVQKNNVEPNNGISYTDFEVFADGKWTKLSSISEPKADKKYWVNEKVDLSAYRGKKVQFRWVHTSLSNNDNGASVTHVVIDENKGSKAEFNINSWNAGKVNYEKAVNSGNIFTVFNRGTEALKVKSVEFKTANFESSIKPGDEIAVGDAKQFNLQFNALQTAAEVEDEMTLTFESGYTTTLEVAGEALANGTYYYSFEPNDLDYKWNEDFTMIDVDGGVNYNFSSYWVHYSAGGQRGAFSVESDSKEDGLYGMMNPISGMYALVGASPTNGSADNWLISKAMTATDKSALDFYARNLESLQSVLPAPKHHVTVLVSEVLENPQTSDFTAVMKDTEMPHLDGGSWNHYTVDLSGYAGKKIKVALRHSTVGASNLAFFDDLTFKNFDSVNSVGSITADISDDAYVEVYSVAGIKVSEGVGMSALDGLGHGFYVVRVADGTTVKAFSIAR
ncbi:MAG: choice-of-anchor J domain-containing protein [Muribaculaceae bacterium]|nr:choice-of-anchor J domain-containing protein [Muribaculaceae bacterium]